MNRSLLAALTFAAAALAAPTLASAQSDYPNRPVTMMTPVQYLDQPHFKPFWDADARKLADVVSRIGKVQ